MCCLVVLRHAGALILAVFSRLASLFFHFLKKIAFFLNGQDWLNNSKPPEYVVFWGMGNGVVGRRAVHRPTPPDGGVTVNWLAMIGVNRGGWSACVGVSPHRHSAAFPELSRTRGCPRVPPVAKDRRSYGTRNRRLAAHKGMFHLAERQMKLVIHRAIGALDVTPPGWRGVPAGTIATGETRGRPPPHTHHGTPPNGGVDSRHGWHLSYARCHPSKKRPARLTAKRGVSQAREANRYQ